MKMSGILSAFAAMLLLVGSANAGAPEAPERELVDGFPPESILAQLEFTGAPDRHAQAAIVRDGERYTLFITHQYRQDVRYYVAVENDKLGLDWGWETGSTSPALTRNAAGSLQIRHGNEFGRGRWQRVLTIAYRAGAYRLVGFTFTERDSLVPDSGTSCDYNFITGQGVRDGRRFQFAPNMRLLANLSNQNLELHTCDNWF